MNDLVRDGYDRIAEAYAAQRNAFDNLPYLRRFAECLPTRSRVLDIGCGSGVPTARFLTEQGFSVLGVDISRRMVELARVNVPNATFEMRDMLSLKPREYEVNGIVALYSVFHVSRNEHPGLFRVLRSFLPDSGPILVTMGAGDWEGTEQDFHGVEMAWSHYGPERNRNILEAAGFRIELDDIDTSGGERHQVLLGLATGN
jgi:cyclopropane fatty-acyl-phospholipid synthase-like methyltransferase